VKLTIDIICYHKGEAGSIYTIKFAHESESELDKFLSDPDNKSCEEFSALEARLMYMADASGFSAKFFKPEGTKMDALCAFHIDNKSLRLFCLRWPNNVLLIIGNGGIKNTRTYQENPKLKKAAEVLQKIDAELERLIKNNEIIVNHQTGELDGKLQLTINL
jgi:hypothetical protein